MRRILLIACVVLVAGCAEAPVVEPDFYAPTSDGRQVAGDIHADTTLGLRPLVLLFHQGDSNGLSEYERIIPRLNAEGYDAITADLRTGGSIFGGVNRTMVPADTASSYCDAYPDLEAVFDYARQSAPNRKPIIWGSSFSAALGLKLASERASEIAGIVAFSPAGGSPMEGCSAELFTDSLGVPALIVRPANEAAVPSVSSQIARFTTQGHRVYIAQPGRHGASTLDAERVGASVEDSWEYVLRFMEGLETQP